MVIATAATYTLSSTPDNPDICHHNRMTSQDDDKSLCVCVSVTKRKSNLSFCSQDACRSCCYNVGPLSNDPLPCACGRRSLLSPLCRTVGSLLKLHKSVAVWRPDGFFVLALCRFRVVKAAGRGWFNQNSVRRTK